MALWSGRFSGKMDPGAWLFNASILVDQRMAVEDVLGSIAWAEQLAAIDVISSEDHQLIHSGLQQILDEINQDVFEIEQGDEDIHSAVERRLYAIIGTAAGKLHTGRSRNDQVATDFRLWVLNHIPQIHEAIQKLQKVLIDRAEADLGIVLPAYTHLQRAQPVLLSHWWLSHFWALERDRQRWEILQKNTAVLPLGSAAVAGTGFPIDRNALAESLGFAAISENSMDAVSDRDFAAEFLFNTSLVSVHLSKLAENMILFSSKEFDYIALDDAFATGSSLMPQKKNPDIFELTRGKTGTMIGLLTGMLSTLKGLPSTYDKDLQEDKAPVFMAFDYLVTVLPVLADAITSLTVNAKTMQAAIDSTMYATDLADNLVKSGIPFREAHGMVGKAVRYILEKQCSLADLTKQEWQDLEIPLSVIDQDLFSPIVSINKKTVPGSTGTNSVEEQINHARRCVNLL